MPSRLSHAARRFLADDVHSVMQLELVLLLHREATRAWTAHEAARELRAPAPWVETQLVDLIALGLVAVEEHDDGAVRYRFLARASRAAVVDEIAGSYPRRRTSIIKAIFSPGPSDVQRFSDAFRLKDDD